MVLGAAPHLGSWNLFLPVGAHPRHSLVRVSPEAYNVVIESYKTPIIGVAELGLVGAILFHGLNGLRVIAVDFWSKGTKYQAIMFWAVMIITVGLVAAFAPLHLSRVFGE